MIFSSWIWLILYLITGWGIFEFFGLGALAMAVAFYIAQGDGRER